MTLEAVLAVPKSRWTLKLLNKEIGPEEIGRLARTKVGLYVPIKQRYAEVFPKLSPIPAREYLAENGITDFRHTTEYANGRKTPFYNLSCGFGAVIGGWRGSKAGKKVRKILAKWAILPKTLEKDPNLEDIFEELTVHKSPTWSYFDESVVGSEAVSTNQGLYQRSKAFEAYCLLHQINLQEGTRSQSARRHIQRFTRINSPVKTPRVRKKPMLTKKNIRDEYRAFKKRK